MSDDIVTNWNCPRCGAVVSSLDDHQCQIDRPMSDIVDRLRGELDNSLLKEAADEIERLRAERDVWIAAFREYHQTMVRIAEAPTDE